VRCSRGFAALCSSVAPRPRRPACALTRAASGCSGAVRCSRSFAALQSSGPAISCRPACALARAASGCKWGPVRCSRGSAALA